MSATKRWCQLCFQPLDVTRDDVCPRCEQVLATFRKAGLGEPSRLDTEEFWLPLPSHPDEYLISTFGRVRSLARTITRSDGKRYTVRDKILMTPADPKGYPCVSLPSRGMVRVNVLMCETFLGPCPEGQLVRHANDDKSDNWVGSLSYGS